METHAEEQEAEAAFLRQRDKLHALFDSLTVDARKEEGSEVVNLPRPLLMKLMRRVEKIDVR